MKTKKKYRTVWKVVRRQRNGKLVSCTPPKGCSQEYHPRNINRPKIKGSGMFVFKTLKDAREFAFPQRELVIFRARATGAGPVFRIMNHVPRGRVEAFWNYGTLWLAMTQETVFRAGFFDACRPPVGAMICKTLRLVKEEMR